MKRVGHISEFYSETLVIMVKRLRHLFAASSMQNANFRRHVAENVTERVRAVNKPNKQRTDEMSCLCSDSRYVFAKCLFIYESEFLRFCARNVCFLREKTYRFKSNEIFHCTFVWIRSNWKKLCECFYEFNFELLREMMDFSVFLIL